MSHDNLQITLLLSDNLRSFLKWYNSCHTYRSIRYITNHTTDNAKAPQIS